MRRTAILLAVLLLIAGCRNADDDAVDVIGSTSVHPFAELLAQEYEKNNESFVDVQGGGSTAGIQALNEGMADIAMCSRSLNPAEAEIFTPIIIARDGLAVVVHKTNPIESLTLSQIADLFEGKIRNWKQLGGPDEPVWLIMREEGSGTREAFMKMVMREKRVSRQALVQESNGSVRELVRTSPGAIGYMSLGFVDEQLRALKVDGVYPSRDSVLDKTYPLVRPFLFVVVSSKLKPEAQRFIDYVLSEHAQHLLEVEGLVRAK